MENANPFSGYLILSGTEMFHFMYGVAYTYALTRYASSETFNAELEKSGVDKKSVLPTFYDESLCLIHYACLVILILTKVWFKPKKWHRLTSALNISVILLYLFSVMQIFFLNTTETKWLEKTSETLETNPENLSEEDFTKMRYAIETFCNPAWTPVYLILN